MFGSMLINFAAWAAGLDQQQLAIIERSFPNFHKLILIAVKLQPFIEKAVPLYKEAEPLINEALPLVNEALKEVKALMPAINIVMAVIERDMKAGQSFADAAGGLVHKLASFKL